MPCLLSTLPRPRPSRAWWCHLGRLLSSGEFPATAAGFHQAVKPGVVYTTETPLRVKVLDRALHDELSLRVWGGDPLAEENGSPPVAGTAPAVKLVEKKQPGGEGTAPYVTVPITSVNTADFQVTGAALKGSVGETVPMKVGFINAGPAWVLEEYDGGPSVVSVVITPPAGTSVVKRGNFCQAKGKEYRCGMIHSALDEGGRQGYTFQLKIDKRVAHAKGSVALGGDPRPFDPDKANDKADVTLDVTGGGSAGSGGSTGGSTNSTGGSGGSTGGDGTTHDGTLAATGSSALPITGAAAAAVATGAGTLLLLRRRRAQSLS